MQSMHSPSLFWSGSEGGSGGAQQEKNNGPSGTGQILSKINSFFFIYNNLFKTNILKDNLKNNLFNIFFNLRLRKYRLLLKRKFLITNDILKIASASSTLKEGSLQASAAQLSSRAKEQLLSHREGARELSTLQESSIFNFEYYLYKMSLSYLEKVFLYWKLIRLNKVKNNFLTISKFIHLIEQIYHKKIVLNIVNLKKMHLNSHIYTQIVSLKLRNRDNKLYRILKASFRKVKIGDLGFGSIRRGYSAKPLEAIFSHKLKNNLISCMFNRKKSESLTSLVFYFFPDIKREQAAQQLLVYSSLGGEERPPYFADNDITKYVIKFIKHIKLRGIRVEAKGRLTRPRTAARSVFKMRYLGGLKKFESSFLGLSQRMLRGDKKDNVSYSLINSNGRNGSFGVKGWVSSK